MCNISKPCHKKCYSNEQNKGVTVGWTDGQSLSHNKIIHVICSIYNLVRFTYSTQRDSHQPSGFPCCWWQYRCTEHHTVFITTRVSLTQHREVTISRLTSHAVGGSTDVPSIIRYLLPCEFHLLNTER